ncbi:hypothetical protein [Sorangium sp. So ce1335]|uniref:hypothetical protein n=1 Tax=Sorangium sp. So ce1335 TaxID=3133335 RepID=UPI003F61D21E
MATAKKTTAKGTTKTAGAVKAKATKPAAATKGAKPAAATKGAKAPAATKGAKAPAATKGAKVAAATKGAKAPAATKGAKVAAATKGAAATTSQPAKDAGAAKAPRGAGASGGAGVFEALRTILKRHARDLVVVHDTPDNYYLDTRTKGPNGKPLFFGAARAGRAYTSFYLMPVYAHPELLADASPELKKRMQGKSCFNFKASEPALLAELEALTGRCFARWKASGQI